MNRFQLESMRSGVAQELKKASDRLADMYGDAGSSMEDRQKQKVVVEDAKERLEGINAQIKALDDEAEARLKKQASGADASGDPRIAKAQAKGEFYKAVLTSGNPQEIAKKAYAQLGAIPRNDADLGYGDKLLPTNMSNELIVEPAAENPMRAVVRLSNIPGLEEPKLMFDLDGVYDDITDKQTANEIKMTGDTVAYDRHKVKVRAKVSDTVIHGSPLTLAAEIDNALRSGLSVNEMNRMFAASPAAGYEGMSFYSTQNAVKQVAGATKQAAVAAALADLPIYFRRNARIVMSALDWYEMWGDNLNQSGMYFEDRPLALFGKPVVLVDDATDPIVGDFNYCRINYDIGTAYDADKDVDAGVYKFVLTAWYDIKLRLTSAFRRAVVTANP